MKIKFRVIGLFCLLMFACHYEKKNDRNDQHDLQGKLIIFHAGSLSIPIKNIADAFSELHPGLKIELESAGSLACARKIIDLKRECDIMLSADYKVIDQLLIPDYADWDIQFATNEMVIAYTGSANYGGSVNEKNWHEILLRKDVAFGRADPNTDPCGYRTVILFKLTDIFYEQTIADILLSKDKQFIRPKSADLNALLEVHAVDYIFSYRSVAEQHELNYLTLPDEINLGNPRFNDYYAQAQVSIAGTSPEDRIVQNGSSIIYGLTILKDAPNYQAALAFVEFILNKDKGMRLLEKSGQKPLIPCITQQYEKIPQNIKTMLCINRMTCRSII